MGVFLVLSICNILHLIPELHNSQNWSCSGTAAKTQLNGEWKKAGPLRGKLRETLKTCLCYQEFVLWKFMVSRFPGHG